MGNKPFSISILILASTIAAIMAIAARGTPSVSRTNLENLPMRIMDYQATEDYFSEAVYNELNADKHIYRHYRSADGRMVDVYIGYYGTSKGGRTPHNPYACFSGAGWAVVDAAKLNLENTQDAEVNYMLTEKSGTYQVILHWYQSDHKVLEEGWKMNFQRFKGLLFRNRNDGAFVRVSVATDKTNIGATTNRAKAFASNLVKMLPAFWPEER